jgi:hypothetical protein
VRLVNTGRSNSSLLNYIIFYPKKEMEEAAPSPLVPKGDEERAATIRILNTAFSDQGGLEVCVNNIVSSTTTEGTGLVPYLPRPPGKAKIPQ